MNTAAEVLRSHARRLNEIAQNTPLGEDGFHAIHSARRTIDAAAEWCERAKCPAESPASPPVVRVEDARRMVVALRLQAIDTRSAANRSGPALRPMMLDLARDLDERADSIEVQIPPRPWRLYLTAGLICYVAGVLTVLVWGVLATLF